MRILLVTKKLHFTKRCIILSIILLQLGMLGLCVADSEQFKPARFILGFYAHSVTEMASRSDIEVSMNFWAKELIYQSAQEIGFNITNGGAILFDTIADMRNAVDRGEIDMVIAPSILLARYFKKDELLNGFIGVLANKRSESVLVIARRDKNIKSIDDFKGKHLLLPANDEFVEMYVDGLFLEHFHKPMRKVAGNIETQNKTNRIVLDVYFNKVDVGVVFLNAFEVMSELNPDIAEKLTIIEQYPIKSRNFGFFVHDYPLAKEITSLTISKFKSNERAKQVLEVFKMQELDTCTVSDLEEFERFDQRYQALKKKYQH